MAPKYVSTGPSTIRRSYLGGGGGGGSSGGGGGGGGGSFDYDARGKMETQILLSTLGNQNDRELSSQRFMQQSALAQQSAQLDAWQYGQRVTEQEAAQLRQDQNSMTAIDADPTLTKLEKDQAKLRIKTRIDWVGERQKRDLQQAQINENDANAARYKQQTELDSWRTKFQTQEINGKLRTIADDDAVIEISSMLNEIDPTWSKRDPVGYQKEIEKEAIRTKRATRYSSDDKGNVDMSKGVRVGMEGAMRSGGARSSTGGGEREGATEDQAMKHYETARRVASQDAKDQGIPVTDEMITKELDRMSGFQSKFRETADTPENRKKAQVKASADEVQAVEAVGTTISANPNLPPSAKEMAQDISAEIKRLNKNHPPGERRHQKIQDHIDSLKRALIQIDESGQASPQAGQAGAVAAPDQPERPPLGTGVRTDAGTVLQGTKSGIRGAMDFSLEQLGALKEAIGGESSPIPKSVRSYLRQ